MKKTELNKKQQARLDRQDKAVQRARKILDDAGVKWIFATDEDVYTALEGDDRLHLVMGDDFEGVIEQINEECIDGLMDSWGDCHAYAIDSVIGVDGEKEAE